MKASSCPRVRCLRSTARPSSSQPWSRNTFFAKSIPTIVTPIFGPSPFCGRWSKLPSWPIEAVIERGAVHPIKIQSAPAARQKSVARFSGYSRCNGRVPRKRDLGIQFRRRETGIEISCCRDATVLTFAPSTDALVLRLHFRFAEASRNSSLFSENFCRSGCMVMNIGYAHVSTPRPEPSLLKCTLAAPPGRFIPHYAPPELVLAYD